MAQEFCLDFVVGTPGQERTQKKPPVANHLAARSHLLWDLLIPMYPGTPRELGPHLPPSLLHVIGCTM